MDRTRVGLSGLGLVFLATLAASVAFAPVTEQRVKEPSEPLAQLGVAPGPEKSAASKAASDASLAAEAQPRSVIIAPPPPTTDTEAGSPAPGLSPETMAIPDEALSTLERNGQRSSPA